MPMLRTSMTVCAFAMFCVGAGAQAPSQDAVRYTVRPSGDGFVRLDTQTGAVSHCARREDTWFCEPVIDSAAMEARLDSLAVQIERLSARIAALEARPAADPPTATSATPEEREFEQALGFSETLMRRFFQMVREIKRDHAGG
jgi:hypothetical protein